MAKRINYWECDYKEEPDDRPETTGPFPCHHPENFEGDCPLKNKRIGQKDTCELLNK